jgi:hypothetical protein
MGTDAYTTGTECGDCPARFNWFSAAAFANALSASKGLAACYQFVGTGCNGVPGEDPSAGGLTCSGASSGVKVTGTGDPYDCEGYRIPTEAEWAKAARGDDPKTVSAWTPAGNPDPASAAQYCSVYAPAGSLPLFTAEAVPAPTGKTLDDIAWWIGSIGNDPYYIGSTSWVSAEAQGVRQKLPAYFGHTPVFDMIGNAPEWGFGHRLVSWADDPRFEECSKVSGAPAGCDPEAVTVNPFGGRVGETYVGGRPYVDLGGEIRYFAEDVSVTYRSSVFPNQRTPGIRVVRTHHGE